MGVVVGAAGHWGKPCGEDCGNGGVIKIEGMRGSSVVDEQGEGACDQLKPQSQRKEKTLTAEKQVRGGGPWEWRSTR